MTAPFDPTVPQRLGSDPAVSAWVSASAGTGKTKVLTDRMLRLLLGGTRPERILCLTFTRAAAAEMANRLNETLAKWAESPEPDLIAKLTDLTGAAPEAETLAVARRLLARVLDAPGGMRIQTVHAFCQSLLGRFPLEAGVSPHFEVLDERGADELMAAARAAVARAARAGGPLAAALDTITRYRHPNDIDRLLTVLAGERARLGAAMTQAGGGAGLTARVRTVLALDEGETADTLLAAAVAEDAFDRAGLVRACAALATGSEADAKRAAVIGAWLEKDKHGRRDGFDAYRAAFLTQDEKPRSRLITKAAAKTDPGAKDVLLAEADRLAALGERVRAATVADSTAAVITLGEALISAYAEEKSGRARLDYDDLILRTCDLLRRDGAAAWVLYKLDGGIDHVLVDEAQDTNPEQWQVIEALAEEFYAGEGARDIDRTLFAVGDVKQSIYSFQRADPAVFGRMRGWVADRVGHVGRQFAAVDLDVSFRSAPAVLQAVDAVFAQDPARIGVADDGEIHHRPWLTQAAGRVELWPPVAPEPADPPAPWKPPVERVAHESAPARLARLIAMRIAALCDGTAWVSSRDRPVEPGDIMVLMRRRTGFVDELSRALKGLGIAVAGSDRLVLTEHIAVMDMIALGRFLLHPEDDLTLATVLKSPFCGLDEDQLFDLAHGRAGTLWRALSGRRDDAAFGPVYRRLRALRDAAERKSPYALFADLIEAEGGRRALLARLGPEAEDPIDELLAQALAYEQRNIPTLEGFLDWLEHGAIEIKRDFEQGRDKGGTGAVRIMTVHGAKGLEAPIVFLPDTMQMPRQTPELLWSDDGLMFWPPRRDLEDATCRTLREAAADARDREYRRLLYVAMTRARDRLIVCGWRTRQTEPDQCWYHLVRQGLEPIADSEDMADLMALPDWPGGPVTCLADPVAESGAVPERETEEIAAPADWMQQPPPVEPLPPRPLAPSRPTMAPPARSPLATPSGRAAAQRGQIIHTLLQYLPELPTDRRAEAARRFLARPSLALATEVQAEIADSVLALLTDPEFAPLFGPGSRAEVPITGVLEGRETLVLGGQIDRLVDTGAAVLAVDYKTGRAPATVADTPPAYGRQMAAYRAGLVEIFPDKPIICALLWTEAPRLDTLPDSLLDGCAP